MSEQLLDPDTLISIVPTPAPPPAPITIDDLLNTIEVLKQKEEDDKTTLENIAKVTTDELKTKLIAWAKLGFPNSYELLKITIVPPTTCSDGVKRNMYDYIEFCSGKQLHEHISILNNKTTGMNMHHIRYDTYISIVVTKV